MGILYNPDEKADLADFVKNPKPFLQQLHTGESDKFALVQGDKARFVVANLQRLNTYVDRLLEKACDAGELDVTKDAKESEVDVHTLTPAQQTLLKIRNKFDFFRNLSDKEIINLTARVSFTKHTKGEYIFKAGTDGKEIYFVIGGAVQICIPSEVGSTTRLIPVAVMKKGQIFGEMAPITKEPRSATTIAATNDTALLCFQIKEEVDATNLKSFFTLYNNFVRILSDKLRQMNQMVHQK